MSEQNKSIQEKTDELEQIVGWFNSDEFALESALDMFTKAEKLAAEIEADLATMQNDIRVVKEKFDTESV